jgi:hypothetical protein
MAHIQYFLEYRNQPKVFRDGANPGTGLFNAFTSLTKYLTNTVQHSQLQANSLSDSQRINCILRDQSALGWLTKGKGGWS